MICEESSKSSKQKRERWERTVKRIRDVLCRCLTDSALSLSRWSNEKHTSPSPHLSIFPFLSVCSLKVTDPC